jgi:acetyl esterase
MLRVHRPKNADRRLPLIVSFHGGGFIAGTAAQNDWLNSHLAARCPAVVVSVEYRLAPQHPLPQRSWPSCAAMCTRRCKGGQIRRSRL